MKKIAITSIAIALTAAAIHAHTVDNPAVQKRMDVMKEIKGAMGVLGGMAKGAIAFDAAAAGAAQNTLIEQSGMVAATFEANETDPKSEALPSIWENWDTLWTWRMTLPLRPKGWMHHPLMVCAVDWEHWCILWRVSQKIPDVKFNQGIEKASSNAAFKLALRIRLTHPA